MRPCVSVGVGTQLTWRHSWASLIFTLTRDIWSKYHTTQAVYHLAWPQVQRFFMSRTSCGRYSLTSPRVTTIRTGATQRRCWARFPSSGAPQFAKRATPGAATKQRSSACLTSGHSLRSCPVAIQQAPLLSQASGMATHPSSPNHLYPFELASPCLLSVPWYPHRPDVPNVSGSQKNR